MSTKPGDAEKVAAIKAILEAAKTELNLIEQICLKDTDIGNNEEVIRAKENLCCLMAPPMSVSEAEGVSSGEITQDELDEAVAAAVAEATAAAKEAVAKAEAAAEKAAAEAKAAAEKAASDAKAAAATAAAEIAKAKADAADAAAAGGDADAIAAAKAAHAAAIEAAVAAAKAAAEAAVAAAKAAAQVEIDAAIARAEAAEAAAKSEESEVVDEKLLEAAIKAANLLVTEKRSKIADGEGKSKEIKIIKYSKKFLPFPKIIEEMTKTIQEQINPSFKANILANGMVLFTKEPNAAGTDGVVQWAIPPKSPDAAAPKPATTVTASGTPQLTASLAGQAAAAATAMQARRNAAAAGEPRTATLRKGAEQPAANPVGSATTNPGGEPTVRPMKPAQTPTSVLKQQKAANEIAAAASLQARPAAEPEPPKTQLPTATGGLRRSKRKVRS